MKPEDQAWIRYHELGLGTHKPVELMHTLLDTFAEKYAMEARLEALRDAVRAHVFADPETDAKASTFLALLKAVEK